MLLDVYNPIELPLGDVILNIILSVYYVQTYFYTYHITR